MTTTLTPYLSFDGNTREALGFYEQALGAKIEAMMRFADMPASATPAAGAGVLGGSLRHVDRSLWRVLGRQWCADPLQSLNQPGERP